MTEDTSKPNTASSAAGSQPEAAGSEAATGSGVPCVTFQNPFFNKIEEESYFQLSEQTGEPVYVVKLAKSPLSLPFKGIRKEFKIAEDSPDGQMLAMIEKSLKFVKGLRIGDPLPKEVTTREASWSLSERHMHIAYQRLSVQLVNWMTGGQELITDPEQLLQLADDPNVKKMVNQAFGEAAEKLGFGAGNKEKVVQEVQALAHELAYIEALRDKFRHIEMMEQKIQGFRRIYGRERSVMEIADQVARLQQRAIETFAGMFLEIDAQTGEILSVLRNLQSQIPYIRDKRDELHTRLMAWDEILTEWESVVVKISPEKPELLRRAYHFLAPRFMAVNEWVLVTKLDGHGANNYSQLAGDPAKKKPMHVMRW